MPKRSWLLLAPAALAVLVPPRSASAQLRVDPGVVVEGQVGVRVYVTLSDEDVPYVPVSQHRMTMTGDEGDTRVVRTDDAGVITLLARPGEYRLTSAEPVSWRGSVYRWDVRVRVRRDMRLVELDPRNAMRESSTRVAGARTSTHAEP
jgi:hypothetical protein